MKTVLMFGASITHGVGGEHGGWSDMVKADMHQKMYGADASGESCTVYELGIPGNTARDVVGRFEAETLARVPQKDPEQTFIIFSAGTNDSKATGKSDNYMHSPDEYTTNVRAFIRKAKEHATNILCIGILPVDQTKTNPKRNPITGNMSYFTNSRIKRFEDALVEACKQEGVDCVPLFDTVPENWAEQYLFVDGLHPNAKGHEWMYDTVKPHIDKIMEQA
jgi:lysophospholipase L1-like esterase